MSLAIRGLHLSIGQTRVCEHLNFTIEPGQIWALLGRNGAGKTQLLHCLVGASTPQAGEIQYHGKPLHSYTLTARAQSIGLLLQENLYPFPIRVFDAAMTGRHPYLHAWHAQSEHDIAIVNNALQTMSLNTLKSRFAHQLSGGEKRRLQIASLLSQQPEIYLLDEPLNHLDLIHQQHCLNHFRQLAKNKNAGIVMALHDIHHAQRYCTHAIILMGDGQTLAGTTQQMLTQKHLHDLYGGTVII